MDIINLQSWDEFENEIRKLLESHADKKKSKVSMPDYIFRGQADASWELKTTMERAMRGQQTLSGYYALILDIKNRIETFTDKSWNIPDYPEYLGWLERDYEPYWGSNPMSSSLGIWWRGLKRGSLLSKVLVEETEPNQEASMIKSNTQPVLLQKLFEVLAVHRKAFGQERIYWRAVGMVLGEIFNFGRHTVTQGLMVLGITEGDWSGWYRLFSHRRYEERRVAKIFFRETIQHTSSEEPYVVGADGVQIPRSSLRMPGTSWMKAPRTPVFKVGIHRAQRFLHGAWLTPIEAGYSRAVPLRFLPAFPAKAKPASVAAQTEGEAGLSFLDWTRRGLDEEGRKQQLLLALADGAFDTLNFWRGLPERTVLAVRTARNRRLYYLPQRHVGPGRPANYGALAPHPWEWLHKHISWQKRNLPVRGKTILMKFQVLGPFVREGLPDIPLFLFVVKGLHRNIGKKKPRWKHRKPSFYLVNAFQVNGDWQVPLPIEDVLAWLWQRWELEVAHREMKSGFGVGEKQCWNPRATISSVQWNVWVYALLLLSAYRTWGLLHAPPIPTAWWHGAQRWSFNTLWRQFRSAFWKIPQFQTLWTPISNNWLKKESFLIALSNSISASARI